MQELLTPAVDTLQRRSPLNHQSLMSLKFLIELSRLMADGETGTLGITWVEYMDAKKLFEKRILLNLIPATTTFFQMIISDLSSTPNPSLTQLLARHPFESLLFDCALEIMESFVEWDFSNASTQPLIPSEIWFTPSLDWYTTIFEIPPLSSSFSASPTTQLHELLATLHKAARDDPSFTTNPSCASRFRKTLGIFARASQFRCSRLDTKILSESQNQSLSLQEKRIHLIRMVFIPLINRVRTELESSIFVRMFGELYIERSRGPLLRELAEEEIQSLTLVILRIVENHEVDTVTLISECSYEQIFKVIEW